VGLGIDALLEADQTDYMALFCGCGETLPLEKNAAPSETTSHCNSRSNTDKEVEGFSFLKIFDNNPDTTEVWGPKNRESSFTSLLLNDLVKKDCADGASEFDWEALEAMPEHNAEVLESHADYNDDLMKLVKLETNETDQLAQTSESRPARAPRKSEDLGSVHLADSARSDDKRRRMKVLPESNVSLLEEVSSDATTGVS
jgi:hypothetical protein